MDNNPQTAVRSTHYLTATFGAGCFWGVEDAFMHMPGVKETAVGYMGGAPPAGGRNPTYEEVCTDETGHAEVVQLKYDSSQVSYEKLLKKFWEIHDPTQLNRQGPDIGKQYRSVIFYHSTDQKEAAQISKSDLETSGNPPAGGSKPIVTEISPASTFWRAEEYHQKYVQKHGGGVCH